MHYEIELGLVMGKTLRDFDEKDEQGALDAIESKLLIPFPPKRTQILLYL